MNCTLAEYSRSRPSLREIAGSGACDAGSSERGNLRGNRFGRRPLWLRASPFPLGKSPKDGPMTFDAVFTLLRPAASALDIAPRQVGGRPH